MPVLAATVPDVVTFAVAAILVMGGAIGVLVSRNTVHAALSLVTTLFGIAVLFIEQEAHFLAAVQVVVYAGAIVILFLFVIMLLGVDRVEEQRADKFAGWRPFAVLFGLAMAGLVVGLANWDWHATGSKSVGGASSGPGSNVDKLADSIFTQYLLPFEATSLLLVIAVVGAVMLARRPDHEDDIVIDDPLQDTLDDELAIEAPLSQTPNSQTPNSQASNSQEKEEEGVTQ